MVEPRFIVLIGPVDYWWNENWYTLGHQNYMKWREKVRVELVNSGHLVYQPWGAFKGAWNERAQEVNDTALSLADVVINLTPPGIPAYGTDAEQAFVEDLNGWRRQEPTPIYHAPPGDLSQIEHLIDPLDDPYSDVHRKSYIKES